MGIEITKSITWRNAQEYFANVYHFNVDVGVTSDQVIDAVVAAEQPCFWVGVAFNSAKAWGPTDQGKAASQMLNQRVLSVNGTFSASPTQTPYEEAAVVEWPTGRNNSRGKPIFLRKYLHVCAVTSTAGAPLGNSSLGATDKTRYSTYGNAVKNVVGVAGASLCDSQGRGLPSGTNPKVLDYLHIRQLRR